MKESRELTEPHESEIYRAGSWDAIGKFQRVNGEDVLFIELTMEDLNYRISSQRIRSVTDLKNALGVNELPEEFLDTMVDPNAGYEDNDYAIFVALDKIPGAPVGQPGTKTIAANLKKVTAGGEPFFIALHVDGNKERKYKRKSSSIVIDHDPMEYIRDARVS